MYESFKAMKTSEESKSLFQLSESGPCYCEPLGKGEHVSTMGPVPFNFIIHSLRTTKWTIPCNV